MLKFHLLLTLDESGDQMSHTDRIELFDADGNLLDTFSSGTAHNTRIKAEPFN
jgi:hypothetical protein